MGVEEPPEEGEVDSNALVPKVHVRGVDTLTTDHLRNYAMEYAPDLFKSVQWIDDTSANLVYDTEIAAADALQILSADEAADPLQLRPARRLTTHPNIELLARMAIEADVKVAGAKDRSRFYLFNPDWDPDTRVRKRRYDERGNGDGYKRRRRDIGDELYHRRGSMKEDEPFDVNLYDDDPKAIAAVAQRRESYSSGSEYGRRRVKTDADLFAGKQNGRLRNRSASPIRDGDGRYGFDDDQPQRRTARARSQTPPHLRKARANYAARDERRKELFPEKKNVTGTAHTNGTTDLFPNHSPPPKTAMELFPDKRQHRRKDAKDIDAAEVTEAFGKYTLDGTYEAEQPTYVRSGRQPAHTRGDLFSRISGGPKVESTYGRLHDRPTSGEEGQFSFKGAGRKEEGGFSILGASREQAKNPLVKELFPMKSGGSGKDLFDGKIKGRGSRRRAEDLF